MGNEERPTKDFCNWLFKPEEILFQGGGGVIARQGKFTIFAVLEASTTQQAAPRSVPYDRDMADDALATLFDVYSHRRDRVGLRSVKAMQAYIDTTLTPPPA